MKKDPMGHFLDELHSSHSSHSHSSYWHFDAMLLSYFLVSFRIVIVMMCCSSAANLVVVMPDTMMFDDLVIPDLLIVLIEMHSIFYGKCPLLCPNCKALLFDIEPVSWISQTPVTWIQNWIFHQMLYVWESGLILVRTCLDAADSSYMQATIFNSKLKQNCARYAVKSSVFVQQNKPTHQQLTTSKSTEDFFSLELHASNFFCSCRTKTCWSHLCLIWAGIIHMISGKHFWFRKILVNQLNLTEFCTNKNLYQLWVIHVIYWNVSC